MNEGSASERTVKRRVVFLVGPAGSGKTHRCVRELQQALLEDCAGPPLLVLTPKQATFQFERQLLAHPQLAGYTRLQILSFERLARALLDELQPGKDPLLDEEGRRMVLRALLAEHHGGLRLFRATARLPGFARQLSDSLREIQEQRLQPDQLFALAKRCADESLAGKLHDLGLVLHHYQEWLARKGLQDPYELVSLAATALRVARRDTTHAAKLALGGVWLDGFAELTPQELELLMEVVAISGRATLAFCLPAFPKEEPPWVSGWSGVTATFRSVWNRVAGIAGGESEVVMLPEAGQPTRFTGNVAIQHLASSWNSVLIESSPAACGNTVRCAKCLNPVSEATFVAREILRYVREDVDRRFREVGVLLRAFEGYHEIITRVFGRYEIPFFLDRREPVAHHPLAELIRYSLRTVAFGWQHEDWFGVLKTGLVPVGDAALDELENETLAHGWTGEVWSRPVQLPSHPWLERRLERTRRQVMPPWEQFARRLGNRGERVDGLKLAAAISGLFLDLRVEARLDHWESRPGNEDPGVRRLAAVHGTVWDQMQTWLQNLELAFAGQALALSDWLPIVESGLSGLTVGVIPPALDQVLVGTVDRSRNPDLQMVVVMGLNEGVFPATPQVSSLLTKHDRDQLEHQGVVLRTNLRSQLSRERFLGYIAMTRARARLILTCAEQDATGRGQNPSPFLTRARQLLPGMLLESDPEGEEWVGSEHAVELLSPAIRMRTSPEWSVLRGLVARHPWLKRMEGLLERQENPGLSPAVADALYGSVLRTSVSALEQFAACPFRFFVQSGLRAAERRQFEVDAREQGSFQHEILARFHEAVRAEGRRWRELAPAEARAWIGGIAAEVTRGFRDGLFAASSEREAEARRLTRLLQDFIETAVGWMAHCAFDPALVEAGFGRAGDLLPAWDMELDASHRLAFRGKIDRVDLAAGAAPGEAACIVVDYKSSARTFDSTLMENGIQIQLPAYLISLREWKDPQAVLGVGRLRPVGMFYVNLRGSSVPGHNRREVLARDALARSRAYRHVGRFDVAYLHQLDTRPGARAGDQFNYRLTATGAVNGSCREPMPSAAFEQLLERVAERIRDMGKRIYAGDIKVDPYRQGRVTACDHCAVQSICRIDAWTHHYRLLSKNNHAVDEEAQ